MRPVCPRGAPAKSRTRASATTEQDRSTSARAVCPAQTRRTTCCEVFPRGRMLRRAREETTDLALVFRTSLAASRDSALWLVFPPRTPPRRRPIAPSRRTRAPWTPPSACVRPVRWPRSAPFRRYARAACLAGSAVVKMSGARLLPRARIRTSPTRRRTSAAPCAAVASSACRCRRRRRSSSLLSRRSGRPRSLTPPTSSTCDRRGGPWPAATTRLRERRRVGVGAA